MSDPTKAIGIVNGIIALVPSILEVFAAHHAERNPDGAPLTADQARALLEAAVRESLAKDAELRANTAGTLDVGGATFGGSTGE